MTMKIKILHLAILTATLLTACQSKPAKPVSNEPSTPAATIGGLAWAGDQDVVCEMKVDQTVEDTVHYAGKVFGFCGASCKETFQENPGKYVGK
jgi:YHS domain-containing protein